ncbi:hypothetical protein ACHAW6_015258 [Cyclotella cf. meneghiniana]
MAPPIVLNVAEKPSVARALAGVFSSIPSARPRNSPGNHPTQVFECDNVLFPPLHQQGNGVVCNAREEGHVMVTTSVRGHLASQNFPSAYGWMRCPPVALFEAPIDTYYSEDMEPLERMLTTLSKRASALILWLDCDREGEAISDEVRTVCLKSNPRLAPRIYRAKFSTVLPQEIRRALRSLGRVNENFVRAVQARSEHDLRVGAAFTRFQTLRLQKKFDGFLSKENGGGVISYGPCQFPTLGFVVERWARIETFVPEDFWFLEMTIRLNDDGTVVHASTDGQNSNQNGQGRPIHLNWKRNRLYDRLVTLALYDACLDAGEAVVTSLTGRPKNKWRPIPLATVELQKRASRYLRIGSEELMQKAEELYQQGFISYPRTETEKFRPEFDHHGLIQSFQAVAGELGNYASRLLSDNNFQNPRAGQNDDNAHPPITPAKAVDPESIHDPIQRKIYALVVKHYLACCSRDAVGRETELTLKIASEEFVAKGLMILERNWLEIYQPWERWSTGQGELPKARVGSRIVPTSLLMNQGQTSPPEPLAEVDLIALMDKNGIGTDATIAQHITTICERNYAQKDANQRFHPTKLGIALVEGYNSMGYQLNKPDLRRDMEKECSRVAAGEKTKEQILGPILAKMLECFKHVNAEVHKLDEAVARRFDKLGTNRNNEYVLLQANFSLCGVCKGLMLLKQQQSRGSQRQRNSNDGGERKILQCNTCTQAYLMPRYHQILSPALDPTNQREPLLCPLCQFQVVKATMDGGNSYHLCPKCFRDPPEEHGGDASTDFPCAKCTNTACSLASGVRGGDAEVFPCPFCSSSGASGKISLRRNATGSGYRLACSNGGRDRCQYCIWLPKEASEISVEGANADSDENIRMNNGDHANNHTCHSCSNQNKLVRKLKFIWKPGSVPPVYDRETITCILCDNQLKSDFHINMPSVNRVNPRRTNNSGGGRSQGSNANNRNAPNNSRNQSSRGSSGGPGRTGGGTTCFRCGETGHYANACPNQR